MDGDQGKMNRSKEKSDVKGVRQGCSPELYKEQELE